jgi:hypothetical protein
MCYGSHMVVSLTLRPSFNDRKIPGTHLCYRLCKPLDLERPEGLGKLKKMHSPHRFSNQRSSDLQNGALTSTL